MLNKTGSCDTCDSKVNCKWVAEQKEVETELTAILTKHKDLTALLIGVSCDKYKEPNKEELIR